MAWRFTALNDVLGHGPQCVTDDAEKCRHAARATMRKEGYTAFMRYPDHIEGRGPEMAMVREFVVCGAGDDDVRSSSFVRVTNVAAALLLSLSLFLGAAVVHARSTPLRDASLTLVPADPARGFYWPYYLAIPDTAGDSAVILLEATDAPIAAGASYTDFSPDLDAQRRAEYFAFDLFRGLGSPLLMAVLPHLPSERLPNGEVFWTLHLDDDIFTVASVEYRRLDLQIVAMIADARTRLAAQGIQAAETVFVDGFSSVGIFANRFSLLHPEIVRAAAIGGAGIYMQPVTEWGGERLDFPVGVGNLQSLTGTAFDRNSFLRAAFYVYVGEDDTGNDPIGVLDPLAVSQVQRLFGGTIIGRFGATGEVWRAAGDHSEFVTYPATGHTLTSAMVADLNSFFYRNVVKPDIRIGGNSGPATVSAGAPLSVAITLDAHGKLGQVADWWLTADTPFGTFSYVHPQGWVPGIQPGARFALFNLGEPFEVFNQTAPPGEYRIRFSIDDNANGIQNDTWTRSIVVRVE